MRWHARDAPHERASADVRARLGGGSGRAAPDAGVPAAGAAA